VADDVRPRDVETRAFRPVARAARRGARRDVPVRRAPVRRERTHAGVLIERAQTALRVAPDLTLKRGAPYLTRRPRPRASVQILISQARSGRRPRRAALDDAERERARRE